MGLPLRGLLNRDARQIKKLMREDARSNQRALDIVRTTDSSAVLEAVANLGRVENGSVYFEDGYTDYANLEHRELSAFGKPGGLIEAMRLRGDPPRYMFTETAILTAMARTGRLNDSTCLSLHYLSIVDLAFLEFLPEHSRATLVSLSIRSLPYLTSLRGLDALNGLRSLEMLFCASLHNLSQVATLSQLASIELIAMGGGLNEASLIPNSVRSVVITYSGEVHEQVFADPGSVEALKFLSDEPQGCTPLGFVRDCQGLQTLVLGLENHHDLSPLASLGRLPFLNLEWLSDSIYDFSFLNGLTMLQRLVLKCETEDTRAEGNALDKALSCLGEKASLTSLHVEGTSLSNLTTLPDLPALTELNLYGATGLHSLQGINAAPALEKVTLDFCGVQCISAISELKHLQAAEFRWCDLQSFAGIDGGSGIQSLVWKQQSCDNVCFKALAGNKSLQTIELNSVKYLATRPTDGWGHMYGAGRAFANVYKRGPFSIQRLKDDIAKYGYPFGGHPQGTFFPPNPW